MVVTEPRDLDEAVTGEIHLSTCDDGVALVAFERPPLNYFDAELIAGLVLACRRADTLGARAIVLASTGKVFCAGADFRSAAAGPLDPMAIYEHAVELYRQPLPMVVAVQGAAIGGGLGLALVGDFRVADPAARFAANFAAIGIHPGFGSTVTLPRVVGPQAAADLLYTGRRVDAASALGLGLVDRLSEPGLALDGARALAREIAAAAPLAVRATRATLRAGLADEVATAVRHEAAQQIALFETQDFQEGVAAVAERRPARFVGR